MSTLKATVTKQKNQFGKFSGTYRAELCGFEAHGTTPEEALTILDERLRTLERNQYSRRYLVTSNGTVFSLWHAFQTFGYDIIHADKPGAQSPSSCMLGDVSHVDAYAAMKSHWEQMEEDIKLAEAVA